MTPALEGGASDAKAPAGDKAPGDNGNSDNTAGNKSGGDKGSAAAGGAATDTAPATVAQEPAPVTIRRGGVAYWNWTYDPTFCPRPARHWL